MTYDPIIVSIPHTGTRFLKERLGIEEHIHTHTNWRTLWGRVENRTIIAPLRRPDHVWRSWCRRRDGPEIANWCGSFFMAWGIMHTLDQMMEVEFVCLDKKEDPRISDWSRIGDGDSYHARWKLHKADLRSLYKLPFVHRHYPSHLA